MTAPRPTRRQPWGRQPGETPKAWEAFTVYRNQGTGRSLTKTAEELGKARMTVSEWSRRWQWVIRAEAWDAEQDRLHMADVAAARRTTVRRNLAVAGVMFNAASQAALKLAQQPGSLTASEVARFVEAASKLEQTAYLIDQDPLARAGARTGSATGAAAAVAAVADLGDEERAMRMRALMRELQSRLADHDTVRENGDERPVRQLHDP